MTRLASLRSERHDEIAVGVVGLGSWGMSHLHMLAGLPGVRVTAVCDVDPDRRGLIEADLDTARCFSSVEEFAALSGVDAASVVTRESDRLAVTRSLLDAGIHLLLEKPVAPTLAEAVEIEQEASARGLIAMPGMILRFDPRYLAMHEAIAAGELGSLRSVFGRRLMPREQYAKYGSSHLALMAAIHDIDIARWYFGAEPESVRAVATGPHDGRADNPDHLWAELGFGRGRIGVIEAGWVLPEGYDAWLDAFTEIVGEHGIAEISVPDRSAVLALAGRVERLDVVTARRASHASFGALREELAYFVHCVRVGKAPSRVTMRDGVESLRAALAVTEAIKSGDTVAPADL